jgi:hypothetical protein
MNNASHQQVLPTSPLVNQQRRTAVLSTEPLLSLPQIKHAILQAESPGSNHVLHVNPLKPLKSRT